MAADTDRDYRDAFVVADAAMVIRRFDPNKVAPDVWAVIGPLVRDAVAVTKPRDAADARELLTRTAALAAWAFEQGIELLPAEVFAPHTLDRFVVEGVRHLAAGSQSNYRSVLHRVAAAVLGPIVYPPRVVLELSPRLQPYSKQEVTALMGWSRGLPTPRMTNGVQTLLALGLGAGLTSSEITVAHSAWVHETPAGLSIEVETPRRRTVPVRPAWETAVMAATERAAGRLLFLPGRTTRNAKQLSRFTESLPRHDAPKLSARRLRSTWIVDLLDAHVPLNALSAVAGVAPEHLSTYVQFMTPISRDEADRLIRGSSP